MVGRMGEGQGGEGSLALLGAQTVPAGRAPEGSDWWISLVTEVSKCKDLP